MRFTQYGYKIDKYVQFPLKFNLRQYLSVNIDSNLPKENQK